MERKSQFNGITCREAVENLHKAINRGIKELVSDIAELPVDKQREVASFVSIKGVDDFKRKEDAQRKREKYPNKDKNQIKFQVEDKYMKLARKFVKLYRIRSVPSLARKLLEMYLDSFYADDKMPDDTDFLELFENLSGGFQREEFHGTKRGASI